MDGEGKQSMSVGSDVIIQHSLMTGRVRGGSEEAELDHLSKSRSRPPIECAVRLATHRRLRLSGINLERSPPIGYLFLPTRASHELPRLRSWLKSRARRG